MCVSCYIIRLATSRPLGERSEPFLAAKRPTASDEVARGRLVSRQGLPFAFRAKNGEWRDSHLGFQVSSMAECISSKERICLLFSKVVSNNDFRRKLTRRPQAGGKKQKTCFNLESILGKEIS